MSKKMVLCANNQVHKRFEDGFRLAKLLSDCLDEDVFRGLCSAIAIINEKGVGSLESMLNKAKEFESKWSQELEAHS